jgi:sulfide:quinone oxidoreductase
MARIVILGAGISGHTAARYLGKWVGKQHEVIVVSPKPSGTGFRPTSGSASAK